MKYVFVAQHKKTWPVDLMCRLLGVTRSGFYGYQRRGGDEIDYYRQELLEAVKDIAKATEDSYGNRGMKKACLGYQQKLEVRLKTHGLCSSLYPGLCTRQATSDPRFPNNISASETITHS